MANKTAKQIPAKVDMRIFLLELISTATKEQLEEIYTGILTEIGPDELPCFLDSYYDSSYEATMYVFKINGNLISIDGEEFNLHAIKEVSKPAYEVVEDKPVKVLKPIML